LAEIRPDGKIRLKVRLYKYPHSSTARLLDLKDGGTSVLAAAVTVLPSVRNVRRKGTVRRFSRSGRVR
jgi:hypothetical protein